MNKVRYKDESARDLRLRVYEGSVDRSALCVLASGSARWAGVEIDAAVIGSSHLIEVRAADFTLTEMLACEAAPTGRPLAEWRPGEAILNRVLKFEETYSFQGRSLGWEEAQWDLDSIRQLVVGAAGSSDSVGLAYQFPASREGVDPAETLVWAAVTRGGVKIKSAHCYPSERLVVVSSTTLNLAAGIAGRPGKGMLATV